MSTITFDTHKFVRRLVAEGVTEGQAQAHVDALQEALISHQGTSSKELATKDDIITLRNEMNQRFAEMEVRLTLRLGGIVMAGVALLGVIVKLL